MYKTFIFATVIVAGVFLAPVATSAAIAASPAHVAAATSIHSSTSGTEISAARLSVPGHPVPDNSVATSHAVGASSSSRPSVQSGLPPVQLVIVWALLALIAVVTFLSVRRMLRRGEDDPASSLD
jgi:hypothetical protein